MDRNKVVMGKETGDFELETGVKKKRGGVDEILK